MKSNREINRTISLVFLILSIISLVAFVHLFGIGFHNLDLGQNMMNLESAYKIDLVDTMSGGVTQVDGQTLYINGGEQMKGSMFGSVFSALIGGISLGYLYRN